MKKLVFAAFAIAVASCRNPPAAMQASVSTAPDTFYLCGKLVKMEKIDSAAFNNLPETSVDNSTSDLMRDSLMRTAGDTLFFKAANGHISLLVNTNGDSVEDAVARFTFQYYDSAIKQFVVYANFYESFAYYLIDSKTGDTTIAWGTPIVSPDKKYFVSNNSDLLAELTNNGLQLFEATNPPKLVCERIIQLWGPQDVKWLNNKTVLMKASVLDSAHSHEHTEYFKMDLR